MKAIWFTDLHLRPSQKEAGARLLSFILEQARINKPDMAICTGDVFHTKDNVQVLMLQMFREFLIELSSICKVYVTPGNHDFAVDGTKLHSLSNFYNMNNVTVVDTSLRIPGTNAGIVAYSRTKERFQFLMNELGPVESLFGHFDLNGFNLGSGWEEQESWSDPDLFKTFEGLKYVYSGHYHLAQEQVIGDIRFIYLGSGYTTDFGESDQIKRLGLVDFDTNILTDIPTGLTLHKTLRIDVGTDLPVLPEEDIKNGVKYRIIIKGTQKQINLWNSSKEKPKDYPASTISFDFVTEVEDRLDISSTDKSGDILKKYVNFEFKKSEDTVKNANLDQEKLIKMGQRFVSKMERS